MSRAPSGGKLRSLERKNRLIPAQNFIIRSTVENYFVVYVVNSYTMMFLLVVRDVCILMVLQPSHTARPRGRLGILDPKRTRDKLGAAVQERRRAPSRARNFPSRSRLSMARDRCLPKRRDDRRKIRPQIHLSSPNAWHPAMKPEFQEFLVEIGNRKKENTPKIH